MKYQSLYTNTGNAKSIVGLLIVTVGCAYAANHADEIVNGALNILKDGRYKAEKAIRNGKEKYHVCRQDANGKIFDTGRSFWK
jgi:hypothetical protein